MNLTTAFRSPFCLLIVAVPLLAMLGCGGGDAKPTVTASVVPAPGTVRKLAFVTNLPADFWNIAKAGIEVADQELPEYTVEFRTGDGTAAKQKEIVEVLLVKGVVGIAISPVDAGNQTAMLDNAASKALALICQDSDAPTSKRAFYLGTDNVAAGREAGKLIKEALPEGGKIMVFVGKKDQQNAQERFRGLQEAVKDSKITIIDLRTDDGDRARAKANAADTLVKYPDIAGMVGLWAYNAPAILSALKDAGQVGKIKVVAFDEEDETLAAVKAGTVHGTVVQQPYEFGYQSMKLMARHLAGDTAFLTADKMLFVPTENIKADTVDAFWAKLKKLRGKVNTPLVEMRGIAKRFGGVAALHGADFSVGAGEVVGLIGENGAGKSTLMNILGGMHQPDAGTISIDGRMVTIGSVAGATALGIAFVHQELSVFENLDIAGNVFLGREPRRAGMLLDRARMRRDTAPILRRVGLDLDPSTPLVGLSLAQRQLVEIAKALSLDARLIIMDEPTSSLTLGEAERLLAIIADLAAQQHTVVYISHRLHELTACCRRAVVLRDGRNAGELAGTELTHDRLVRLMVGRDLPPAPVRAAVPAGAGGLTIRGLRTAAWREQTIDLDVRRGEVLGLAGLVGAGRSELARAVFGIDRLRAGTVALDGKPLRIRHPADAIRAGLALVPEDRKLAGLVLAMAVRENTTLATLPRHVRHGLVDRGSERLATAAAIAELGIKAASGEVTASSLSGGNQQKIVLAKWLAAQPQVIILDEPTRGVDVGAKQEIYALMRRLTAAGAAVLMISSDMEEVIGQSDRVAVMHEGALTGILAGAEIDEEAVMRLAVGQTEGAAT